jgi:hypothetical protein
MFESWWKARAGIGDADMAVIPEYLSERLREEHGQSGERLAPTARSFMGADWLLGTVWVGGLEEAAATPDNLTATFGTIAEVHSVNVRVKPGGKRWPWAALPLSAHLHRHALKDTVAAVT